MMLVIIFEQIFILYFLRCAFLSGDSMMSQTQSIHRKMERQSWKMSHTCHGDNTVLLTHINPNYFFLIILFFFVFSESFGSNSLGKHICLYGSVIFLAEYGVPYLYH